MGATVDRLVYAFRPIAGAKRMDFRRLYQQSQARGVRMQAHEGAKVDDTRGGSWISSRLSPDSALEEDLLELRSRSRELYKNDSIGGAVDTRVNLVVSYGFTPQATILPRDGITAAQAESWNDQLEQVYDQLYGRIGISGKESWWQCLRLAERHNGFDGESFTIMSDVGESDKPVPLAIEVIDPERVETPPDKAGNPRVRMGIEYDSKGKIVAYWIRRTHPGDAKHVDLKYDRIEAARVLHVYEKWFAGQSRGYPWMTRTLNRIKDGKDFGEATLIAAQVEACHAAFVKTIGGAHTAALAASGGVTMDGNRYQEIRPGGIHYLNADEEISFGSPSRPGSTFAPFMEWNGRNIAAAMNFPYEMLGKNWGGLSFAAGRLVLSEARQFTKSEQKLLIESWLSPIWGRMVEEAVIVGAVDIPPRLYQRMPWAFQAHQWGPPAWPFALTPREEIEARLAAIEGNLDTKQNAISELGGWWREVFAQRAVEREEERTLKIQPGSAKAEAEAEAQPKEPQDGEQELEKELAPA